MFLLCTSLTYFSVGKAFSVHSNLTAHIPTHTGVKQFKCTKCEKSFVHASSLHKHMKTHSAPKQGKKTDCVFDFVFFLLFFPVFRPVYVGLLTSSKDQE